MRRLLLPLLLCSSLWGRQASERIQQDRVFADTQAILGAMQEGRPIPEVSTEPGRYGPYKALLDHFHDHAARLYTLKLQVESIRADLKTPLKPTSLVDPEARKANHERLAQLVDNLGQSAQEMELLIGERGQKAILAMPGDPRYLKGAAEAFAERREQFQFMQSYLAHQQDYYRAVDKVLTLADPGLGLDAAGHLAFQNPQQQLDYQADVEELRAKAQILQQDAKAFQPMLHEARGAVTKAAPAKDGH